MFSPIYLQIKPGEGGKDSELFAQDLMNVYKKHALRKNLKFSLKRNNPKLIEAKIEGKNCYSYFYKEIGSHRIQRVPPTENRGRIQTSIVNVLVLEKPIPKKISLDNKKMKFSYYKDSGKGGQHRNKTMSGVRIQYENITIECCDTRDQRKNKEIALFRLSSKIKSIESDKRTSLMRYNCNIQNTNKGSRGNYNRNYNFPRNEVTQDGNKFKLKNIMRGDLDQIYEV